MEGAGVCSDVACRVALPTLRRAQRPPIAASIRIPCHPASPHEPVVLQRRGTPRRDKKTHVSLRGMVYAWRRWQRAAFGRNADRKADCRGGVFAMRRFPRPPSPTTIRANRAYGDPTVFVATRRAASFSAFMPPSCGTSGLYHDVARRVAILDRNAALSIATRHATSLLTPPRPAYTLPPSPYLRPTNALPGPLHVRVSP